MNVVVNALLLQGKLSGVQYSIENMMQEVLYITAPHKVQLIVPHHYSGILKNKGFDLLIAPAINSSSRIIRILWENTVLPFHLWKLKRNDLIYHSPAYVLPFICPALSVVTIHDLIALQFPGLCQNETAVYFRIMLPATIRKAKRIIAVSETVKKDIINRFGTDPAKIDVVYHGIRPHFRPINDTGYLKTIREKYFLPDKYLLFVGNLEPKKNIPFLLRAYNRFLKYYGNEFKLVIVGREGWKFAEIYQTIRSLQLEEQVRCVGYVPDADLPAFYNLASLFVFPSLYEGFGLPVLEAMACGVPVIISERGALSEIAGGAALISSASDEEVLCSAMHKLLSDDQEKERYSTMGLKRAAQFSWKETAVQVLKTYQKLTHADL